MGEISLLPCPFCGGAASVEEIPVGAPECDEVHFSVGCDSADEPTCMGYQNFTTFARRGDAFKAWNTRLAAQDEARERVIEDDGVNGVEAIAKLREFDRFALVIESAVRNADAPNWPRVFDLLKRTRVFMSIMGPKSLSPSNPTRMQGEEE